MHKVTTINLNGKAFQLEEKGYAKLHEYLEHAANALDDNPDKKEILADLEQAIADKCERFLGSKKDVVNSEQVDSILAEMGPVQDTDSDAAEATDDQAEAKAGGQKPRKLYVIPKGAMIFGVCKGIAAYLGVDATIIRIIFVVLAIGSGGFWVLLYFVLAFVLPYAKTDEQLAEAYGRRVTAQEIVEGAKDRAKDMQPALNEVGTVLGRIVRVIFGIVAGLLVLAFGLLTVGWLSGLWGISFYDLHLTGQLVHISRWMLAAGATALYFLIALPLLGAARISLRVARHQEMQQPNRRGAWVATGLWFVTLAAFIVIAGNVGLHVRDYVDTHKGYLDVGNHHWCVDDTRCDPQRNDYKPCLNSDACVRPSIPERPTVPATIVQ